MKLEHVRISLPDSTTIKAGKVSRKRQAGTRFNLNREFTGLCRTCTHRLTCTFPRLEDRPVMLCEEFDGESMPPAPTTIVHGDDPARWALANREWYPGLCNDCEKLETCEFPRPQGGVFHCEDYK